MLKAVNQFVQHHHFADGTRYDRHAGKAFGRLHRRVATEVASAAPEGATVLDAGCGSGRLAGELARRRPDLHVHGVDLERGMIEVATDRAAREKLTDRVDFAVADLADLPLPDGSVDFVVSTASLHHWTDVEGVIDSLARVLRPDGQLWIYDLRWVPVGRVRSASASRGRRVERTTVRTGRLPFAFFQRFEIAPA
ncbi:MAG TPA: class I SAM-dependent methyltransferase [Amycolatopsis sp.]|jgi:ubiquinone/menaquinone biosynthesis C-methylase UbiE|nr:class I SAM-dependent methyltransferase [Amycolatopsis sp.]